MTREDAKQWIHRKFNQGEAERLMADLIIKALEQEPSEDDVIITYDTYHDLIADRAEKLEQEPKTGHWINTGSGQECSKCHEIQYGYDNHRFYCPNCGAKMESEVNNG